MAECANLLLVRGAPMLNLKAAVENYRALFCLEEVFGNRNPVELEVGCGNGGFILEKAKRNLNVNYLALEICSNVILTAMERANAEGVKNVRYLNIPAEILPCYLGEGSVRKIYLNFSTPLPEKSREKQRLTATRFLQIYRALLSDGGTIEQKTDSEPFFDYSLEQYAKNGFEVREVSRDLHRSAYACENIVTEYERNFASKGLPIYRAVAVKTNGKNSE